MTYATDTDRLTATMVKLLFWLAGLLALTVVGGVGLFLSSYLV